VSGTGATGEARISRSLSMLHDDAEKEAQRLKDEYVSVEHLVLAMINTGSRTAAGRLLKERGVTADRFLDVLTQVRGAQRVTSATPRRPTKRSRSTAATSSPRRAAAAWTRSSAATPRSAA
jgi:ATP-dependent Clp protease ATP-binding subunit ClpB